MGRSVILGRLELRELAADLWRRHWICRPELSELAALSYLPATEKNSRRIVDLLRAVHGAVCVKCPRPVVVSSACAPPGHCALRR